MSYTELVTKIGVDKAADEVLAILKSQLTSSECATKYNVDQSTIDAMTAHFIDGGRRFLDEEALAKWARDIRESEATYWRRQTDEKDKRFQEMQRSLIEQSIAKEQVTRQGRPPGGP